MNYLSTRGDATARKFCDILLEGLAPDGGLYLPQHYPQLDAAALARLRQVWRDEGYAALAFEILSLYIDDIPADDLRQLCAKTYTPAVFGTRAITPLKKLEEGFYLEALSNGPTLAFKDMAMQLLGNLFEYELARKNGGQGAQLNILGATSGDTGSAAEYAMRGKRGIRVFMLSPHGRMSAFQQAQMFSLQDANIHNIAIEGVFDDCQDIVKAVSADLPFKRRYRIGTVSSICAGHVARMMGLPIRRLIVATNENDVLDEFFRTGLYRVRGSAETFETSSPSMDISKASNFERFVFDLLGRDAAATRALFGQTLAQQGQFDLSRHPRFAAAREQFGFASGKSTHADRLATIRSVHGQYGVLVDTHTADGVKVARQFAQKDTPMIVLETALPIKFAATIREALGRDPDRPAAFNGIENLPRRVRVMPADAQAIKAFIAQQCA